jgi:hypothetical protein
MGTAVAVGNGTKRTVGTAVAPTNGVATVIVGGTAVVRLQPNRKARVTAVTNRPSTLRIRTLLTARI